MIVEWLIGAVFVALFGVGVILAVREYAALRKVLEATHRRHRQPGMVLVPFVPRPSPHPTFQRQVAAKWGRGLREDRLVMEAETKQNVDWLRQRMSSPSAPEGKDV